MSENRNLLESPEDVKKILENDIAMKAIKEQVAQKFVEYRKTMSYLACDAPISSLCLPIQVENILIANGFLRIYDVFDVDFTKIKGFGPKRIGQLTARLDEFLSVF